VGQQGGARLHQPSWHASYSCTGLPSRLMCGIPALPAHSKLDTPAFLVFALVFFVMRIVVYPFVVLRA
jgi:hypothetical protein